MRSQRRAPSARGWSSCACRSPTSRRVSPPSPPRRPPMAARRRTTVSGCFACCATRTTPRRAGRPRRRHLEKMHRKRRPAARVGGAARLPRKGGDEGVTVPEVLLRMLTRGGGGVGGGGGGGLARNEGGVTDAASLLDGSKVARQSRLHLARGAVPVARPPAQAVDARPAPALGQGGPVPDARRRAGARAGRRPTPGDRGGVAACRGPHTSAEQRVREGVTS